MTTALAILAITLAAALALTLRTTFRLVAQRDAERRRGDLALAEAARRERSMKRREQMLLDDLDFACEAAVNLQERLEAVQARELPQLSEIRERKAAR